MSYLNRLTFSKLWTNAADFPTYEADEAQVRADLQLLHSEARDALNALVDALSAGAYASNLPVSSPEFAATNLLAALEEIVAAAKAAQAGTILDGSIAEGKLDAALREKLAACDVAYSMNPPTAAENPDSGYPAAKLWLRPPFTVRNLASDPLLATGADWTAEYGVGSASGGAVIVSGTGASQYGKINCTVSLPAGHTARVYVKAEALAGQPASLQLYLNGTPAALTPGTLLAADAAADANGSVTVSVLADWSSAAAAQTASFRLVQFAAVDETALALPGAAALTEANLDALAAAALPFAGLSAERQLYAQQLAGDWVQIGFEALPAGRGGTGRRALTKNALLAGNGTEPVQLVPIPSAGDQVLEQNADGTLGWKTPVEVLDQAGGLRWGSFSYTGDGSPDAALATRVVQLPFAPKIAFYGGSTLLQGKTLSVNHIGHHLEGGAIYYSDTLQLSGDTLTLYTGRPSSDVDKAGWTYNQTGVSYSLQGIY